MEKTHKNKLSYQRCFETPKDKYNFGYFTFLMIGVCILQPWNTYVEAVDYLQIKVPNHDIKFFIGTLSSGPVIATQMVLLFLHKYDRPIIIINISLISISILSLLLPLLLEFGDDRNIDWAITVSIVVLISIFNGGLQICGYGIVGKFPQN